MGKFEYYESQDIADKHYSWLSLLFALIRKADSTNIELIKQCWPDEYNELYQRYNAPGGTIFGDKDYE